MRSQLVFLNQISVATSIGRLLALALANQQVIVSLRLTIRGVQRVSYVFIESHARL